MEIEEGSLFFLVGPTGHGKTTLLRIIAGVEKPDKGEVYFDEQLVNDVPARKRNVAMVYQGFVNYPTMNVYENIASPLKINKKLKISEIDKLVKETASLLRIEKLLNRRIKELSGGEQQRVAIARALVKRSPLLLLDEPLGALDYKIRESLREELANLAKDYFKGSLTIVFATSDPIDALMMATHVGVLINGKLIQAGRLYDVYNNPRSKLSTYLSYPPMNFLEASLVKNKGKVFLTLNGKSRIDVTHMQDLLSEEKYIIGIRGGELHPSKTSESAIQLLMKVKLIETTGSTTIVHMEWQGSEVKMYENKISNYNMGEEIPIFINPQDLYIFDEKENLITKYQIPQK
jgi:glycerol transport system ATP-binding protein